MLDALADVVFASGVSFIWEAFAAERATPQARRIIDETRGFGDAPATQNPLPMTWQSRSVGGDAVDSAAGLAVHGIDELYGSHGVTTLDGRWSEQALFLKTRANALVLNAKARLQSPPP